MSRGRAIPRTVRLSRRERPYESPMKERTGENRDVKYLVGMDHSGHDCQPAEMLHDGADRIGNTAPQQGTHEEVAVTSRQHDAKNESDPAHRQVKRQAEPLGQVRKVNRLERDSGNVIAKQDLTIHSGPRKRVSVIGHIAAGQTVQVTGVNDNKKWWRVICPDGSVGSCWISADPNLTTPTGRPANADVQNVEIRLLESYPLQVQAVARGLLPDAGCTTILGASQKRSGNIFTVTINTTVDPQALCAPALTPFEQVIPLEVDSLLPGPYIVRVNSVEAGFELPAAQPVQ